MQPIATANDRGDSGMSLGPFCGSLGCRNPADVVIDHPEYGERTVCDDHADDYPVITHV